jgi:predicted TIM-barrel fold metal-dependent hydrolase
LVRFPHIKIAFSESQVGWMPFILERVDNCYTHTAYAELPEIITQPPSSYVPGRVYGCFFDDNTGVVNRDAIGINQMVFEIDYPHQDSTWPNTHKVVERIAAQVSEAELERILRGNAIDMLGLDPVDLRPQPAQR